MALYLILIFTLILFVLAFLIFLAALFLFGQLLILKAPFVKAPQRVINTLLTEVGIKPEHLVYDLGCGDAAVLIAIDKKIGAKTTGFELHPLAYTKALTAVRKNNAKTKILFKSFFKHNFSDADVIFCFLVPALMKKVGAHLEPQLKQSAMVISYAFPIPQWHPNKIIETLPDGVNASNIYIYNR